MSSPAHRSDTLGWGERAWRAWRGRRRAGARLLRALRFRLAGRGLLRAFAALDHIVAVAASILHHVAIAHDVLLALHAHLAGRLGRDHRAIAHEVVERDDFGLDEAALEVGVDHARRLWCGPTLMDGPGARLLWSGGEIGLQAECAEADARQLVETRFVLAHGGEQFGRFALRHVHEFGFDLGVQEDRLCRRHECGEFGALRRGCEHRFVHVEDVDDRLRRQQAELLNQRDV